MSVILQILLDPEHWFQLFWPAIEKNIVASFGAPFGNLLGEIFRGAGLLGGDAKFIWPIP